MQQQRQASLKNRRLAQQMANRPSVIAALKIKRRSLRQRLGQGPSGFSGGGNVKSRLSFGRQGNQNLRGRLGGSGQAGRSNRGRGVVAVRRGVRWSTSADSSNNMRSGTSPMLKARLGNQSSPNKTGQNRNRGFRRGQGFGRNYRQQRGSNFRGQQFRNNRRTGGGGGGIGGGRKSSGGRGRRQNRGRGGGGGRNWGQNANINRKNIPSKQELDNQLDEYMAKTKSHLDAELDAYMAQADS